MTKTFKLVREFSTGTRCFEQTLLFTVFLGTRDVEVRGSHSEQWSHVLDISEARPLWDEFLSLPEGRSCGGFMSRWRHVKN